MIPLRDTNPSRNPPVMTLAIIAVNAIVFVLELTLPPDRREWFFYLFGFVPARYSDPSWAARVGFPVGSYWPFLTSMFLHAGWLHILGNMWFLWLFGDNVEDRMGPWRFLVFYLVCGLAAGLAQLATNFGSTVPTVGASGAIAGVLGAYLVLFPRARVLVLLPILIFPFFFELPAVVFLGLWFVMQLFSGTASLAGTQQVGGVAWWAHVGGFLVGAITHRAFLSRRRRPRPAWIDV